jgi:hypothetical protein
MGISLRAELILLKRPATGLNPQSAPPPRGVPLLLQPEPFNFNFYGSYHGKVSAKSLSSFAVSLFLGLATNMPI